MALACCCAGSKVGKCEHEEDFAGMFNGTNRPGERLAGNAGPVLAMEMEGGLKNAFASIKAFSETDFKARRKFTIRVDLMVSGLPNQDEINADLLQFFKSVQTVRM